jgi:hypothetical protein
MTATTPELENASSFLSAAVHGFSPAMMAPCEGTLQVQVEAIVADDEHGFVLVRESALRPVAGPARTAARV